MSNNTICDRTLHVKEVAELLEVFSKQDYRIGQTILNAVRASIHNEGGDANWDNIIKELYNMENKGLCEIIKNDAVLNGFLRD